MPATVSSSDLRRLSPEERESFLADLYRESANSYRQLMTIIEARLREFESRYELASSAVGAALASGSLRETNEVREWMFWHHLRNRLGESSRSNPSR